MNGVHNGQKVSTRALCRRAGRAGSLPMPLRASESTISPADRRREVASILANGVIRWCVRAQATENIEAEESVSGADTRLKLFHEMRLRASDGSLLPSTATPDAGDRPSSAGLSDFV